MHVLTTAAVPPLTAAEQETAAAFGPPALRPSWPAAAHGPTARRCSHRCTGRAAAAAAVAADSSARQRRRCSSSRGQQLWRRRLRAARRGGDRVARRLGLRAAAAAGAVLARSHLPPAAGPEPGAAVRLPGRALSCLIGNGAHLRKSRQAYYVNLTTTLLRACSLLAVPERLLIVGIAVPIRVTTLELAAAAYLGAKDLQGTYRGQACYGPSMSSCRLSGSMGLP